MKNWFKMLVVASLIWIGMIMFLGKINFDAGYKLGVADGKQDAEISYQYLFEQAEEGRIYYLNRAIQLDCEQQGFETSMSTSDGLLCCKKEKGFLYCEDYGGFDKIPELSSENITIVNEGNGVSFLINASYDNIYCDVGGYNAGYEDSIRCDFLNWR